jgi:hypothetical protein
MPVTIKTKDGKEANILNGKWQWTSDNALLVIKLDTILYDFRNENTLSYDPYPDLTAARNAITELKKAGIFAEITDEGTPPKYVKGRVY